MRVGLTVWNGRISPVMDTAGELLVAEVGENGWRTLRSVPLGERGRMRTGRVLGSLNLDAVVCGAVSRGFAETLADLNVTVIAWVAGEVESVLDALADGTFESDCFRMPGCGRAGRGSGRGRGRRRGGRS